MPSIEEELRTRYHQSLVLKRLCDTSAQAQSQSDPLGNEEGFWNGMSEQMDGLVVFLFRMRKTLPVAVLICELPAEPAHRLRAEIVPVPREGH